ncbi:MAG: prolyl-tRNA synthetase associated domain-containing protein [Candidatus Gracilibacteria bacterium]|jgi:Ala-tRNA(Pro) deacylase
MPDVYKFLEDNKINYTEFKHPAVYTCEEAERLCPEMPGAHTKNIFLRDKNGERHFLVVVGYEKNVDLKSLKELFGVSKLSFASPERLKKYLGVEPGSVTLLGLMNDTDHAVEVYFDEAIWEKPLLCHPLVNTATLAIPLEGIKTFLAATRHKYKVINVVGR